MLQKLCSLLLEIRTKQLRLLLSPGTPELLKLLFESQASFFCVETIAMLLPQTLNQLTYILMLPLLEHVADPLPLSLIKLSTPEALVPTQLLLALLLPLLSSLPSFTSLALLLLAALLNQLSEIFAGTFATCASTGANLLTARLLTHT
ncbi:MAG: hypothetical protein N2644_10050, partial [Candidatus Sumerlaea chitinivorans]|nr:hypothetical protein [Candidatus Sumerlaea chitinivorans]